MHICSLKMRICSLRMHAGEILDVKNQAPLVSLVTTYYSVCKKANAWFKAPALCTLRYLYTRLDVHNPANSTMANNVFADIDIAITPHVIKMLSPVFRMSRKAARPSPPRL